MTLALAALLASGTSGKLGVDGLHVRHDRHVRGGAGGDQAEVGAASWRLASSSSAVVSWLTSWGGSCCV